MGCCVLPAGLARPGAPGGDQGGLPKSAQATTVNKVCGSGMQTVIMASEALAAGSIDLASPAAWNR
jgi:acetyl-CoA C-acetyltransferase